MIVGHIIRSERKKQNMKQSYLAKGICSPSYLSKIENNITECSPEILELISSKLGINLIKEKEDIGYLSNDKENKQYLSEIYKEMSINRSKKYAREISKELIERRFLFTDKDSFYLFYLVCIRTLIVLEDKNKISEYLNTLLKDRDKLNDYESYLFVKTLGFYNYYNKNIQESIRNFEEVIIASKHINLPNWEKADLYYMYSLACLSNNQNVNAIEYSGMALEKFKENFQFERSIESLIIQGISYKNSFNFQLSMRSYEKAIEIIDKFKIYKFRGLVFQNLGSLYIKLKEYNKALDYYLKSLDFKKSSDNKVVTIFSIIQIYSRLNENEEMNIWIQKGLDEIRENNNYSHYAVHFNIYKLLGEGDEEKIELFLLREIPYFEDNNDYRHLYKYCIKIGQLLRNKKKYKKAAVYFEKAFGYLNNMENNTSWEDI